MNNSPLVEKTLFFAWITKHAAFDICSIIIVRLHTPFHINLTVFSSHFTCFYQIMLSIFKKFLFSNEQTPVTTTVKNAHIKNE